MSRALVDGTESEYTYNGDNLRQTKSVDGALTTHILDGANVVADISDSGTKTFVRGNSLELFKAQGGSTKTYLNSYPRNDVSALVDSDGSTSDYIYTAYGEKIGTNDNTENPFGYCGEYFDTETGLVYLRNRYYDPTMHRFISEDPAKDGLNWYAYASCNPTKYVDPWGLKVSSINNIIVERTDSNGNKYKVDTRDVFLEQIIKMTGDSGYYLDGNKLMHKEGCDISGGSEIARAMVSYLVNSDIELKVKFSNKGELSASAFNYSGGANIRINGFNDSDELTTTFVHELTHAYTCLTGIDNKIIANYKTDNEMLNANLGIYIKRQHQEATAITVEEQFRSDMGYAPRSSVTDKLIGVNNYAQFPMQLTSNPKSILPAGTYGYSNVHVSDYVLATTLYTYSEGIVDYILSQN